MQSRAISITAPQTQPTFALKKTVTTYRQSQSHHQGVSICTAVTTATTATTTTAATTAVAAAAFMNSPIVYGPSRGLDMEPFRVSLYHRHHHTKRATHNT